MASGWEERVSSFCGDPSRFLSTTSSETFLSELLRELRDDKASYNLKLLLLSPLCEYPALVCPSNSVGEETALELMSIFAQCPPRFVQFRCQLLVALTCVLLCSSGLSSRLRAFSDFLDLLLQVAQDISDIHGDATQRTLRATACDCLREVETSCPGLLSQRLELLGGLRLQESSRLHQAYAGLQTLALRNAVFELAQEGGNGAESLKALLVGNASPGWEADQEEAPADTQGSAPLSSVILGPMGTAPTLHIGPDCKELRSVLSSLLEESYLFTSLYQAAVLYRLTEVVAMVPAIPPTMLRAQLLRLLGTCEVSLLHVTLLMKSAFTDSLFSSEDEAFLLRRLVVLSQHPLVSAPEQLFYLDCLLHFPENRPVGCGDETLPVLLTPRLASVLLPTVFNDGQTLLARFNLMCLVCLEEGAEEESRGAEYLFEHLSALLRAAESGGGLENVVVLFRAAFLFLLHFQHVEHYSNNLRQQLCQLYLRHPRLSPHLVNLADQTQVHLPDSTFALGLLRALQRVIAEAPIGPNDRRHLSWHLKVLARAAEEGDVPQQSTLNFLFSIVMPSPSSLCRSGDWRLGSSVLAVCSRLLVHPSLDSLLLPLADVLQQIAGHYNDTDIRDHARLYYALLTTLSREKLASVLAHPTADGGQQAKKRTLSCLVTESEGLISSLTIHPTEASVFQLTETESELTGAAESCPSQGEEREAGEAVETYRAQFGDPDFASEISLKFQLTHTGIPNPRFQQLFSIRLHFRLTDQNYNDLQDVSVPCLLSGVQPPVVRLTLKPKRPRPTTLHVSAIFTTDDGLTWHTSMPDVHVRFQQIFLPLPAPRSWARAFRLALFEGLWDEMCREAEECANSLFCCPLDASALTALVGKHFLPFLVSDLSHGDEYRVLLFLPPRSHILLKISSGEDAAQINIATDNWQLLPHINDYLLSVTTCSEGQSS